MFREKTAGLLYGPAEHHIDHLAPLCSLLGIPLIVTEEEIASFCLTYYPSLEIIHWDYLELPEKLVSRYDTVFYCIPRLLFEEIFFFAQHFLRKKVHTVWCPHGNSDKGNASTFMEVLKDEEMLLLYGKKMFDFLTRKEVFKNSKRHVFTGNFRYTYYQKHQLFYDELISRKIKKRLKTAFRTFFFAPTWQDREHSSSFFDASSILIEKLPEESNLIIKLHPNLLLQASYQTEEFLRKHENTPHVLFLTHFPPIYPLLDFVDIYIGDMSSIGYDFLTFDKPMFFLNQNNRDPVTDPGLYLYQCGVSIKKENYSEIYNIIDFQLATDGEDFSSLRKEVYDDTFGKEKSWTSLREEIVKELSFL